MIRNLNNGMPPEVDSALIIAVVTLLIMCTYGHKMIDTVESFFVGNRNQTFVKLLMALVKLFLKTLYCSAHLWNFLATFYGIFSWTSSWIAYFRFECSCSASYREIPTANESIFMSAMRQCVPMLSTFVREVTVKATGATETAATSFSNVRAVRFFVTSCADLGVESFKL